MSDTITKYGTKDDFWLHSTSAGFDLTRDSKTKKSTILTQKGLIAITPSASALIVIDMQNFFLHPEIRDHPTGLEALEKLKLAIPAALKAGMKVIFCNWGLTDEDVSKMTGAHASSFGAMLRDSTTQLPTAGFGFEMGTIDSVDAGRLLFRDSWNAGLYGELDTIYKDAVKAGNDQVVWIHKNRMSAMWGDSTLLEEYLVKEGIKTLFWSGVNSNQCVKGSAVDAHNKGYDTIYIKDCAGTNSPDACRIATEFDLELVGFSTTTDEFVNGLK